MMLKSTQGFVGKRLARPLAALLVVCFVPVVLSAAVKPTIVKALSTGDTTRAVSLLIKQIEVDPQYHLNYYTLAEIARARGQYQQAKELYEKALDRKGSHYESLYGLGLCQLHDGDLDDAQKSMEKGRKKAKGIKDWFENGYGLVMMARKNYREADRAFRQALVLDDQNPEYHINLGDANFFQGIPSLAIIEYEKALEADTASLEVYFHWAEACLKMKDYNCAIEKLKIVLTKDSTYAPAWMRAGGIYFKAARSTRTRAERTGRFKDAIGSYLRYLELSGAEADSANVRPYFELAMSYINVFGFEDATKYFDKVLAIPYVPRDIYFYYGKALWGVKEYVKSGEMLVKHQQWSQEDNGDYQSKVSTAELNQLLGDSYYYRKPKDFKTAIEYYQMTLAERPTQKRLLYNVAVGYHSLKEYANAIKYYDLRAEQGVDSSSAGIYKNAGYCALNIANGENGESDDIDDLEEDDGEEGEQSSESASEIDPNINYYELAADFMEKYLEFGPSDAEKILQVLANTYLYRLGECTNGIKYFERLQQINPASCEAMKSLGYAYFGGVCNVNYTKALKKLNAAYKCISSVDGACGDVDLVLWIAQCYHLRAAEKVAAKDNVASDYENAFNWYSKVLKCDPSNVDARKGQEDTRFEF